MPPEIAVFGCIGAAHLCALTRSAVAVKFWCRRCVMAISSSWTKLRSRGGLARGMQLTHHSHELKAAMRGGMVASVAAKSKGLKRNAISFASNVVIGIASTAPAYSLASALGVIAGIAAYATPGIMLVAFIPMFCVATAYLHLNRADPDCGTTFSWATR